jgi:Tfp pilus assembly protein FimT
LTARARGDSPIRPALEPDSDVLQPAGAAEKVHGRVNQRFKNDIRAVTLLELVFVASLLGVLLASAVPLLLSSLDEARTRSAARYLAGRLQLARAEAVKRGANVGIRVEPEGTGYQYAFYVDGNGNGVRSKEIAIGIDRAIWPPERLQDQFSGVRFGVTDGVTAIDSSEVLGAGSDPIRLGNSNILSFSSTGAATAGSLYIRGRGRQQSAVRVLGVTGRVRALRFDFGNGQWVW